MSTEESNETTEREEPEYPLAFDANGNPIDLPPEAVRWRVRRGGGRRGRPRHVFDPETGRQLEVPLAGNLDTLIEAGCEADRYLLYPVDGQGIVIPGIVAVIEVPATEDAGDAGDGPAIGGGEKNALLAVIANQQATMKDQLGTIQEQSHTLCRALEATTSGYGRVRPAEPTPVVLEGPAPPEQAPPGAAGFIASLKPEQIAEIGGVAKMIFEMFKGAFAAGGTANGGGA